MRERPTLDRLAEISEQMATLADLGVAPWCLIAKALVDLTTEVRALRYDRPPHTKPARGVVRGTRRNKVSSTVYMTPEQLEMLQIVMKATRRTMTSLISEGLDMAIERREAECGIVK